MTKHFGPAHLKRDMPGLKAFAFAGEAPRTLFYGTGFDSVLGAPIPIRELSCTVFIKRKTEHSSQVFIGESKFLAGHEKAGKCR
jgi:hypothetical protein